MWPTIISFIFGTSLIIFAARSSNSLFTSGSVASSTEKLITWTLSARATSRGSGLSPRFFIALLAANKLLSISFFRSNGLSACTFMAGAAAFKSAISLSRANTSDVLTVIVSPSISILAFGTLFRIGNIVASCAAAGMSVAKLSSTSARHLLASSPNTLVRTFITLVCKVSSPTLRLQAYSCLFSPVAIRNDAGWIFAIAAPDSLPCAPCCTAATAGVATGSGFSWQPLSNAQANAPNIIKPIIGSSAFIKLPCGSSVRCKGAVLTVSEMGVPVGVAASALAGRTVAAHAGTWCW